VPEPLSQEPPKTESPPAAPKSTLHKTLWVVLILGVVLIVFFVSPAALQRTPPRPAGLVQAPVQDTDALTRFDADEKRMDGFEARMNAMEARLGALEKRAESGPSESANEENAAEKTHANAAELAALQASLKSILGDMKQLSEQTAESRISNESSVAAAIAFIQLRAAAEAGRGFASEIQLMQTTTGGDAKLADDLTALGPFAPQGAPTLAALRESFLAVEGEAENAMRKASAVTWQERLKAMLQGLISVRDLKAPSSGNQIAALDDDLAARRLGAALEKEAQLPEAARAALQNWREQAMARLNLDAALDRLAADLVAKAKGS